MLERIVTAGVYVNIKGCFPFQVGPTKRGDTLGVVRLGGHREAGETGWQCASREAWEEASVRVNPIQPPATYWYEATDNPELRRGNWQDDDECSPILIGRRPDSGLITTLYLARSYETPVPAMETKGILMLQPDEIQKINSQTLTLGQYLESGGQAVFKDRFSLDLVLEPFPHLRLLEMLINRHPEIADE